MNCNRAHKGIFTSPSACAVCLSWLLLVASSLFYPARAYPNGQQGGVIAWKLSFTVTTGDDDLRGGNDNLNVGIHFRDGNVQWELKVNKGRSWGNNTLRGFDVNFPRVIDVSEIASIEFRTTFTGGTGGDNWDMASVSARAIGPTLNKIIATHGFYRFTGDEKSLLIPVTFADAGKATRIELTIQTGGDDLRGDNDNLNITIHFLGGSAQLARNINGGRNWPNGSTHVETITLDHAVDPSDIVRIDLQKPTTCFSAVDCDNWDMKSILVSALGEGLNKSIAKYGFKRFTAIDNSLTIPVTMAEKGKANKLEFTFQTGGDDLRSDNQLDITIHLRSGHTQLAPNINGEQGWASQSMHAKTIYLDQASDPSDIVEVDLQTRGGVGGLLDTGDNWDMESVTVKAIGPGVDEVIFRHGFKRFKDDPKVGEANDHTLRLKRDQ